MAQSSTSKNILLGISRVLSITGFFLLFWTLSSLFAAWLLGEIQGLSLESTLELLQAPPRTSTGRYLYLAFQGISALGAFVICSWLFLLVIEQKNISALSERKHLPKRVWLLSAGIMILLMPALSWVIAWNAGIDFPESWAGFEQWAKHYEQRFQELTFFLTRFGSWAEVLLGLLVMAVLPGIGEELLFRGLLQRNLNYLFPSWLSILVAALVFSAIHLQFYGFVPRFLLGALLGYLYWWSGNIWVAAWAHFVNNAFTLLMVHFHNKGYLSINLNSSDAMPLWSAILSLLFTFALLYYFHTLFVSPSSTPDEQPESFANEDL